MLFGWQLKIDHGLILLTMIGVSPLVFSWMDEYYVSSKELKENTPTFR
jgi:hypothetical protein